MDGVEKFRLFANLAHISRTGWVQRGVKDPESVAEHIYGCFLLATFLLPETDDNEDYDKQTVLQMLLLHDLPEAVTGDIPRPVKKQNPGYYEQLEQQAAEESLLSGDCTLQQRSLWQQWSEQTSYNAKIAKDIDDLQAIYTFCCLHTQNPDLFEPADAAAWLDGLQKLQTPLVRRIAAELLKDYTEKRDTDV